MTADEGSRRPTAEATLADPTEVGVADFVRATDRAVESVDVRISLGIIRRFSEGLYSSPNKTFEELVSNSYDAGAQRVWVYLPNDLSEDGATIVVVDDGESMDVAGLRDLWMIGESTKRDLPSVEGRQPIGKFGIGKLATYVLANELTYIVARDDEHLAITMDYSLVEGVMTDPHEMRLLVAQLSEDEAQETLRSALARTGRDENAIVLDGLFGEEAPRTWTAAVLGALKPPAQHIQQGRLRWVLSTAIPLNPAFRLFYNDQEITSSKIVGDAVWEFVVGRDESELPEEARVGSGQVLVIDGESTPSYRLPQAGTVWGSATLYSDPLERGKSELLGRSHGFFIRVRRRLINLEDPSFNLGPELHHGTLTRLHVVVNADDLDPLIASPRESIQESPQLQELKDYLLAIFNRARGALSAIDESDMPALITKQGRIARPPSALSQGPLRRMIRRAVDGDERIQATLGLDEAGVESLGRLLEDGDDLIEQIVVESLADEDRLVSYDPQRHAVVVNQEHPFINNYIGTKGAAEPLRLLGLTELLTHAYMLDEDIAPEQAARVMARRDRFLRDFVARQPRSAKNVARQLRDASNDERLLEDAVADALELLGFTVQRIGGTGFTDGIASARLGHRENGSESYAATYDAKSSGRSAAQALQTHGADEAEGTSRRPPRIKAATAQSSILRVHRERAKADHGLDIAPEFTLLVAPGFQGDGVDDSLIAEVCRNDGITPITVENLARLVELFPVRGITPLVLRPLFDCRTPDESRAFVEALESEGEQAPLVPVGDILNVLFEYSERRSAVTVDSLTTALYERSEGHYDIDPDTLRAVIRGLAALAPRGLYFDGRIIALNAVPSQLIDELHSSLDNYPSAVSQGYRSQLSVLDAPVEEGTRKSRRRRSPKR